jgi:hypothetical protein
MTGFTDRTVRRALGAPGPIQPRIAPVTAPESWSMWGAATTVEELEELTEIEALNEPGDRPARRERPRHDGTAEPWLRQERGARASVPHGRELGAPRERESSEQDAVAAAEPLQPQVQDVLVSHRRAPREQHAQERFVAREREPHEQERIVVRESGAQEPSEQDLLVPREQELDAPRVPASSRVPSELAPRVPSFRASRFALRMASSPPPRSTRGLDLEAGVTLEAPETATAAVAALASEVSTGGAGSETASTTRKGRVLGSPSEPLEHAAQRPPRVTPSSGRVVEPGASSLETEASPWASSLALDAASTRSSPRGSDARGPVVRVQIGRVEVRAPSPPAEPLREQDIPKPEAFVSLQQYLHKRGAS